MRLAADQSGVTAIEYGLIAALIAVAVITVMGTVGTDLSTTFSKIDSSLRYEAAGSDSARSFSFRSSETPF
jgi:pilus assembly protein Flp/PilA